MGRGRGEGGERGGESIVKADIYEEAVDKVNPKEVRISIAAGLWLLRGLAASVHDWQPLRELRDFRHM